MNSEVDANKEWAKEMKDAKIWAKDAQDELAGEIERNLSKNSDNVREVQRGDTMYTIVRGMKGLKSFSWRKDKNMEVEYRGVSEKQLRKNKAETGTGKLNDAGRIYPGQYVWLEGEKVIVSTTPPEEKIATDERLPEYSKADLEMYKNVEFPVLSFHEGMELEAFVAREFLGARRVAPKELKYRVIEKKEESGQTSRKSLGQLRACRHLPVHDGEKVTVRPDPVSEGVVIIWEKK